METVEERNNRWSIGIKHKQYSDWKVFPLEGIVKKYNKVVGSKSKSTGYIYTERNKIKYSIHRIIYKTAYNVELTTDQHINHINFNRTDNTITNLEIVTSQQNSQWGRNRTGEWKGVHLKNKRWQSSLKHNGIPYSLGGYETELEGAMAYNDFALFMNNTTESRYFLNEIEGYIATPRDVVQDNKLAVIEENSSIYIGVQFPEKREEYTAGIRPKGKKTQYLGTSKIELDCAKMYNSQALYYNNNCNGTYKLNIIPGYINIEKDILGEKKNKNKDKFIGVRKYKLTSFWMAYYTKDKKQITIGHEFVDKLDAIIAYNKHMTEINKTSIHKYSIHDLTEYIVQE